MDVLPPEGEKINKEKVLMLGQLQPEFETQLAERALSEAGYLVNIARGSGVDGPLCCMP